MDELKKHIDGGDWLKFFTDDEIGHVLTFFYNMFKWLERDEADTLEFRSTEFVWSKNQQIVGRFPITVPEPVPTFREVLLQILDRDTVIQKYFYVAQVDPGIFTLRRHQKTAGG